MPSIAPTNWPMISGRSGLPKFMLSVMRQRRRRRPRSGCASSRRPPARRRAPDRRGNSAACSRSPAPAPCRCRRTRTTAASPPGRLTVLPITRWSYCSQIQRFEARSGQAMSRCRHSSGSRSGSEAGSISGSGSRRAPRPLVERRLGDQRPDRDVGGDLAVHPQHQPPGLGDPADHREIELPFLEDRGAPPPRCRGAGSSACAPGFR